MLKLSTITLIVLLAAAAPALPCGVSGTRSHEQLVDAARVILLARAERLGDGQGPQGAFAVATQVRFRVLAVYKGVLASETLQFNGTLQSAATPDRPTSYDFNRARSHTPSCFNPSYRAGVEYLLLLGSDDGIYSRAGELTPYWGPMEPTNERVVGDRDPWLVWVLGRLGR